jgi:hypothetical protein
MKIAKVVVVQLIILAVGLACVELALATFMPLPVHGGIYLDQKGDRIRIAQDDVTLKPNLDVTHVSSEFSARIRTNELGYRKVANESIIPQVIFLGDSFAFGHGVADEEVFSSIVCAKSNVTCQNLGRSGTDTFQQLKVLTHALEVHGMRPQTVVLVMLTACWLGAAGNDIGENYQHYLGLRSAAARAIGPAPHPAVAAASLLPASAATPDAAPGEPLIKKLQRMLGQFEIVKRVMLIAASGLKRGLYGCSPDQELEAAMPATAAALGELEKIAAKFNFKVEVFTIHHYQELAGTFQTTERLMRGVMPKSFDYFPTARHFREENYFPYDGHFNPRGHARLAAVIEASLASR